MNSVSEKPGIYQNLWFENPGFVDQNLGFLFEILDISKIYDNRIPYWRSVKEKNRLIIKGMSNICLNSS